MRKTAGNARQIISRKNSRLTRAKKATVRAPGAAQEIMQMSVYINRAHEIVEPIYDFGEDAATEKLRSQNDEIEDDISIIEELIGGSGTLSTSARSASAKSSTS
jgi:hypothetical protein